MEILNLLAEQQSSISSGITWFCSDINSSHRIDKSSASISKQSEVGFWYTSSSSFGSILIVFVILTKNLLKEKERIS